MNPRWIIVAVVVTALLFLAAGVLSSAEPPKPAPTFTIASLAVENDQLVVRFKAVYPSGMVGTWDPEAVKQNVARLVTVLNGRWDWTVFTPLLRGSEPPPPPPDQLVQAFTVEPDTIKRGGSARVSWACPKAKSVTLNGLAVAVSGSQIVSPDATTAYNLAATDGLKIETAQRILTVSDTPPPPPVPGPLSVLVVYEQEDLDNYPPGQPAILTSKPVRDYLAAKCAKENGVPTFRFLDKDADISNLMPGLKAWFEQAKSRKLPTIILSNGRDVFQGDLPVDPAAMLELLKKYGD